MPAADTAPYSHYRSKATKYSLLALGALAAGAIAYRWFDKRLAYYYRAMPQKQKQVVDWTSAISSPEFALTVSGGMLLAAGYKYKVQQAQVKDIYPFVYVPVCVGITYVLKRSFKYIITRKRPLALFVNHEFGFEATPSGEKLDQSFPSGHASNVFTLVHSMSRSWPQLAVPLYATAAIACLGRVAVNDHYLSDIVAGAFVGILLPEVLHDVLNANGLPVAAS